MTLEKKTVFKLLLHKRDTDVSYFMVHITLYVPEHVSDKVTQKDIMVLNIRGLLV